MTEKKDTIRNSSIVCFGRRLFFWLSVSRELSPLVAQFYSLFLLSASETQSVFCFCCTNSFVIFSLFWWQRNHIFLLKHLTGSKSHFLWLLSQTLKICSQNHVWSGSLVWNTEARISLKWKILAKEKKALIWQCFSS